MDIQKLVVLAIGRNGNEWKANIGEEGAEKVLITVYGNSDHQVHARAHCLLSSAKSGDEAGFNCLMAENKLLWQVVKQLKKSVDADQQVRGSLELLMAKYNLPEDE